MNCTYLICFQIFRTIFTTQNFHIMIQRIQSLYLSLTIIVSALFLSGNYLIFVNSSGTRGALGIAGLAGFSEGGFRSLAWYLVTGSVIVSALMVLIAIFLYRNRKLQARLVVFSGVLTLLALFVMAAFVIVALKEQAKPEFHLRSFLPFLNLILLLMAARSIRKDENLVKSLDRLR